MRYEHRLDQWHEAVCHINPCGRTIPWNAPVPLCREHALEVAREYADVVRALEQQEADQHDQARDEKRPIEIRKPGRDVVYYVRIADYIKIGYTRRLQQRIRQLRAGFEDLLAIEDGDRTLEAERHHQFRADRLDVRRENFRPSGALLAHIEALGGRATLPDWAKRPDTTKLTLGQVR